MDEHNRVATDIGAITESFRVNGYEGLIGVSLSADQKPVELVVILWIHPRNKVVQGYVDLFTRAISEALQRGTPVAQIVARFTSVVSTSPRSLRAAELILNDALNWMGLRFK